MNKVFLMGYVESTPKKFGYGDSRRVLFHLRVPAGREHDSTSYISIICFRERSDFAEKYMNVGKKILVEGYISQLEGKSEFEVVAESINFVESLKSEKFRISSQYR